MRRLPPLTALRAFEAAARHGSFVRAAAELSVTPGAISQHVKGLEQLLGLTLFQRQARGVRLTEAGRAYLPADAGMGLLPAAVISHGRGGMPGQPPQTASTFRSWGLAVIATRYTHAANDDGGMPMGGEGASEANVKRAMKARALLSCLGVPIDASRIARWVSISSRNSSAIRRRLSQKLSRRSHCIPASYASRIRCTSFTRRSNVCRSFSS